MGALFIDRIGGALIFPFLSLYVTAKFGVGMTEVGSMFAVHSLSSFFGNMFGGALADKYGRKTMLIIGLIISAGISLGMGFIQTWELFYLLAFLTGFVANIGSPAAHAMVADILPPEKRPDGFGIWRVAVNLAVTIGPALGGLMAGYSYMLLFITDFTVSCITAGIVLFAIPETKPQAKTQKIEPNILKTIGGYSRVLKDKLFMWLLLLATFTAIVYMQMNTTLSVYLNSEHNISPQQFGYILSLNAAMVVLMQFPISARVKVFPSLMVMAAGNLFYAVGFGMYGFVSEYWLFLLAMVVITIGEMVIAPVIQTIVANIAPEDMRARYSAVFHLSWGVASAVGPLAAGIILDNANPDLVWIAAGIICLSVALGYLMLRSRFTEILRRINHMDKEPDYSELP